MTFGKEHLLIIYPERPGVIANNMFAMNSYKMDLLEYFRALRHVGVYRSDIMRNILIERFVTYLLSGDFDQLISDDDYYMLTTLLSRVSRLCHNDT